MSQKPAKPLIAKLQSAPDPAWGPLLAGIDDAVRGYDPETQTGNLLASTDSRRATGSGGATALSAEDGQKVTGQDASYRSLASGGSTRFPDDGTKGTSPQDQSYRTLASGGSTRFPDDGTKG